MNGALSGLRGNRVCSNLVDLLRWPVAGLLSRRRVVRFAHHTTPLSGVSRNRPLTRSVGRYFCARRDPWPPPGRPNVTRPPWPLNSGEILESASSVRDEDPVQNGEPLRPHIDCTVCRRMVGNPAASACTPRSGRVGRSPVASAGASPGCPGPPLRPSAGWTAGERLVNCTLVDGNSGHTLGRTAESRLRQTYHHGCVDRWLSGGRPGRCAPGVAGVLPGQPPGNSRYG